MQQTEVVNLRQITSLLSIVAKDNGPDTNLNCCFVDPINRIALAGYRRLYDLGDCLVRAFIPNLDMSNVPPGVGNFVYGEESFAAEPGLPGKFLAGRDREYVDAELANLKFNAIYDNIHNAPPDKHFTALLNPMKICKFIEERTHSGQMENKKITMQAFDGVNHLGEFISVARFDPNSGETIVEIPNPRGQVLYAFVDEEKSLINLKRVRENERYVFRFLTMVGEVSYVQLLREARIGVRFAIQHFPNGLLMPYQPRYSVHEERDNKITQHDILDHAFIAGPQGDAHKGLFSKAPYLHFDVDTLYRALKPMTKYKVVRMHFKDSVTGVLIESLPEHEGDLKLDAIIGATSPYKSGKVYTR